MGDKAKSEIGRMLSIGVIECAEEPTEWCSGLTIDPKSDDNIRLGVELTASNKGVKRVVYSLL